MLFFFSLTTENICKLWEEIFYWSFVSKCTNEFCITFLGDYERCFMVLLLSEDKIVVVRRTSAKTQTETGTDGSNNGLLEAIYKIYMRLYFMKNS